MSTLTPPPQGQLPPPRMIVNPLPPVMVHSAFWEQAARAAWIAPLIGLALGFVTLVSRENNSGNARDSSMIVGFATAGLTALGMLFALAALYGAFVKKIRGLLPGAIAGLLINGLLIFIMVSVIVMAGSVAASRDRQVVARHPQAQVNPEEIDPLKINAPVGAAADHEWEGRTTAQKALVTVTQYKDNASAVHELKSELNASCRIIGLSIDNSAGDESITLDPDSVLLKFSDGHVVKALPTWRIFGSAKHNSNQWMRQYACLQSAPARGRLKIAYAFVPDATDFSAVTSIRVDIDGQPVEIPGRVSTK